MSVVFSHPLLSLTLTLLVWSAATRVAARAGAWANPVLVSTLAIVLVLLATGTSYRDYRDGVGLLTTLLIPAVVALAVPISRHASLLGRALPAVVFASIAGTAVGIVATMAVARALGASRQLVVALAPKHATSAVAASVADVLNGDGSLAAVLAVLTGIAGAVLGIPLLRVLGVRDPLASGLAMGVSAHAIGTARALEQDPSIGAMSAVGMAVASLVVPTLIAVATVFDLSSIL